MTDVFKSIPEAFGHLFKDPVNFMLFLVPGLLALALYILAGSYVLTSGLALSKDLVGQYVSGQNVGTVMTYFLTGVMAFMFFILVSWTFVIVIGILSAPFNSVISARIEKKMRGGVLTEDRSQGLTDVLAGLGHTLFTEFKKITVMILATVLAMALNFVPFLFPVALILLSLIMAAQFLDYSWSRHDLSAGACLKDLKGSFLSNALTGATFLLFVSIPLLNILVPALATCYYTVLWTKRQAPRP